MQRDPELMIARGVYSTLTAERRALLQRMQTPCSAIYSKINAAYTEAQSNTPNWDVVFDCMRSAGTLVEDIGGMLRALKVITDERIATKPAAWGGSDE